MGAVPQGVSLLANRNSERHQPRRRLKVRLADVGSSPSAAINPMPTINKSRPNHNKVVHAAATKINCTSPRCLASALRINAANLWCHVNGGSKIYVRVLQRQYKIEDEGKLWSSSRPCGDSVGWREWQQRPAIAKRRRRPVMPTMTKVVAAAGAAHSNERHTTRLSLRY